jgi:hypothetical protein
MPSARSLLARVQRLEEARRAPRSPFEEGFGSLEDWEADWRASIDAGTMCAVDGPHIIACIHKWHANNVWGGLRWVAVRDYAR